MKYEKICRYAFILSIICAIIGFLAPAFLNKMQFFPWSFLIPFFIAFILGSILALIIDGRVEILPGLWIEIVK